MAQLIDGRALSQSRTESLLTRIHNLKTSLGRCPKLAVILVGDNPASHTYVQFKTKRCLELHIESVEKLMDASIDQADLFGVIHDLNNDKTVDGILLQLPLPSHLNAQKAVTLIHPSKDVDGLHPYNQGLLLQGRPFMVPCTPQGCLDLIHSCCDSLAGAHVVVVGRSILVGRPLAALLTNHNATVTLTHSKTSNLQEICRTADILIAATGRPGMITGDFVKSGAIVIDVGQSHVDNQIKGDVDFASVSPRASFLTPTTGGVGPMTIINLMENVIHAAESKLSD